MKTFTAFSLVFGSLVVSVAGSAPLANVKRVTNLPVVPGVYIVELDPGASIPGQKRSLNPHEELYASLTKRGVNWSLRKQYNKPDLYVGASVKLGSDTDLATLANTPGVKSVQPAILLPRPAPLNLHVVSDVNDAAIPPDTFYTHTATGVDKLHAEGNLGKGIQVGIIDTGIDYNHPFLGGGFGPGFKVNKGYDLVGDNYDGSNDPVPDSDPLDECEGHGTHVAGIIGANPGNQFGISGVAYESNLAAYRVFGCGGSASDEVIIDALLRADADNNDVITLSIGGPGGWTESVSAVVASNLAKKGRVVTISAGNDGGYGGWFTSSPATGIDVIAVSSIDGTVIPVQNATASDGRKIPYYNVFPLPIEGSLPIYAISTDLTDPAQGCEPLPDDTPDLSPYLVLIRRGTCPFLQKLENVAAKGAKAALIYNNGGSFNAFSGGVIPGAVIGTEDGAWLVQQFIDNTGITISFPQDGAQFNLPNDNANRVSSFSTYGPTSDMFFKPAVGAPGGGILSTYPIKLGSFALLSGTSMSCPFVAGSSAVLLQTRGKGIARSARTIFETTSKHVASSADETKPWDTLSRAGAGLIDAFNAVHYTTAVTPGELLLNDTVFFKGRHTIQIKNNGAKDQTYTLSHVPAGTALTYESGSILPSTSVPLVTNYASVNLSQKKVTVKAGRSASVGVTIAPPSGLDAKTFPVYSGWIQITSNSGETLSVSYLGLAASIKTQTIIDNSDYYFGVPVPLILDGEGNVQAAPQNYTFVDADFPTLIVRLAAGTPTLNIDLVSANTNFKPTITKRSWIPSWGNPKHHPGGSYGAVKTLGNIFKFAYAPRSPDAADPNEGSYIFSFDDASFVFADGSPIPNGSYKLLVRGLKVTGNPTRQEDYESWLSPVINVSRP